jgi:outer membrane receptor for ferrienterochelin and colicins
MYKPLFFLMLLVVASSLNAQTSVDFKIKDSVTNEPLIGATLLFSGTRLGSVSDFDGNVHFNTVPLGDQTIIVKLESYVDKEFKLSFPLAVLDTIIVLLAPMPSVHDEIIIEATRANRSIVNLPTRIEVLTEEIDEAASMESSKISHLLTHSTGIQVQTTSASSNGAVVRIQGLNGRYTQLLKDGFPLYGGFSGSLDIMQIPPLDLRQVEYIKGSASTLYGGGAIGGLINLLSKTPTKDETLLHINMSHIGSKDFNAFSSKRFGKFGFTNLATIHLHSVYDADLDGFSDLAEVSKFNFNPKLFYYPNAKLELYLGANISKEERNSGDMSVLLNNLFDVNSFYFDKQSSTRYTSQFQTKYQINNTSSLTAKNSVSSFDRLIQINSSYQGGVYQFSGNQLNSFSELNYNFNKEKHNINTGVNFYTNDFTENNLDTFAVRNQMSQTIGVYSNYLWSITSNFILESGLRADKAMVNNKNKQRKDELFVLPRLSALYKVNRALSLRLGGGMGYRLPTLFNEEAEPFGYQGIEAVDFTSVNAERSTGANFDFKYVTNFNSENLLLSFNQMFFYNYINNPILLYNKVNDPSQMFYANHTGALNSRGFESQIKFTFYKFTWFVGYTYNEAFINENELLNWLTLTPKHSIKGDLLFVEDNKWRIGWDYEYKSSQLLSSGIQTPTLFTTGIIVERTIDNFVLFVNAENFTDVRQSRYGNILSGPNDTPQYTEVWAPLDGFFFNGGLKIKL